MKACVCCTSRRGSVSCWQQVRAHAEHARSGSPRAVGCRSERARPPLSAAHHFGGTGSDRGEPDRRDHSLHRRVAGGVIAPGEQVKRELATGAPARVRAGGEHAATAASGLQQVGKCKRPLAGAPRQAAQTNGRGGRSRVPPCDTGVLRTRALTSAQAAGGQGCCRS